MLKLSLLFALLGLMTSTLWAQDLSTYSRKKQARGSRRVVRVPVKKVAKEEKWIESVLFNLGTHTEFYNSVQTSTSGEVRKFDAKAPTIGVGLSHKITDDWRFLPEFNWVLPRDAGSSQIMKNLFMFRADWGYDPLEWLRLRVGTSLMLANQHGKGGKVELSNGTSTSTFYYPDENRSSINNTLDFGLEARYESFAVRLQSYIYSVFIEEKRQVSYTLFVSYYWDQ